MKIKKKVKMILKPLNINFKVNTVILLIYSSKEKKRNLYLELNQNYLVNGNMINVKTI